MANKCYVYCKFKDDNAFRAYSLEYGPIPAGSKAYATMMFDNERAHATLQKIADLYKEQGLVMQLRTLSGCVKFTTK